MVGGNQSEREHLDVANHLAKMALARIFGLKLEAFKRERRLQHNEELAGQNVFAYEGAEPDLAGTSWLLF